MKYVALLRGINVGGNSKVEMSKLRNVFESLGFQNVLTYINSGNVIFETTKNDVSVITSETETALLKNFSFSIKVVIRDSKNFKKLCLSIPEAWENNNEQKTDILFLWDSFDTKKTLDLITRTEGVDTLLYVSGAIIWNIKRDNYSKSGMKKFVGTNVYKNMTARNVNTVRKLIDFMI